MSRPSFLSPRRIAFAVTYKFDRLWLRLKLAVRAKSRYLGAYQANPFAADSQNSIGGRQCADRFSAFSKLLPDGEPLSTLDIGCNDGYFTFRMAERGGLAVGVDSGSVQIDNAQDLARLHKIPNAVFARIDIDDRSISGLPRVDLVICLSIFHHWARKLGEENAKGIMRRLAERTRRYMVFETGQPDETNTDWAKDLLFMGADHDAYVLNLLREIGFESVINLGQFPTSISPVPRNLYLAEKPAART
jgi:SAM-dependent methyltransferase